MKNHRKFCFHLSEKDHIWLEKELNYSNGVSLISYTPIKKKYEYYRIAELSITSSSAFHEFMDSYSLWERLYFYEDKRIVPITESKYTGVVYED